MEGSGSGPVKPRASIAKLLNPELLSGSVRVSKETDIGAREHVKSLLGRPAPVEQASALLPHTPSASSSYQQALDLLQEEFLSQRHRVFANLNRARKQQIEEFLRVELGKKISFEQLIQSKPASSEHHALLLFARYSSQLFLLQVALLKKWAECGLIQWEQLWNSSQTVNWKVSSVLKKLSPQGLIAKEQWNFLKANIFSWFAPSNDLWENLKTLILNRPTQEINPFDWGLLSSQNSVVTAQVAGALLRTDNDLQLQLIGNWPSSLLEISLRRLQNKELAQISALSANEFTQYCAEILALWQCAPDVPKFCSPTDSPLATPTAFMTQSRYLEPNQQIFFFPSEKDECSRDAWRRGLQILEKSPEGSQLVFVTQTYWPTESNDLCREFREQITKIAAIKTVIDARQLVNSSIPRCISSLVKSSQKEQRDCHRPQILRLKGNGALLSTLPTEINTLLQSSPAPGEQVVKTLGNTARIESMSAATIQGQLKSSPWTMLCEEDFFSISSLLRRLPHRCFNQGALVPNTARLLESPLQSIHMIEVPGQCVLGATKLPALPQDARCFLFVPDKGAQENPLFFSAWINSSVMQFWYRLESDQNITKARTAEKLLKLAPMVRLGSRQALGVSDTFSSLETCFAAFQQLWSPDGSMLDPWASHDWIIGAELLLEKRIIGLKEIIRHLYPELEIFRWSIPRALPKLKPFNVFSALSHLAKTSVLRHPAIEAKSIKGRDDFRFQDCILEEHGPVAALVLKGSRDQEFKISGPNLYVQAIYEYCLQNRNRSSQETLSQLSLPLDAKVVMSQVEHFQELFLKELINIQELTHAMDLLFGAMIGLGCSLHEPGLLSIVDKFSQSAVTLQSLPARSIKEVGSVGTKVNQ